MAPNLHQDEDRGKTLLQGFDFDQAATAPELDRAMLAPEWRGDNDAPQKRSKSAGGMKTDAEGYDSWFRTT